MEISEREGVRIKYRIRVETIDMRNVRGANEPNDNIQINRDARQSRAVGEVVRGADRYTYPRQVLSIRLESESAYGTTVEIMCSEGFGYDGPVALTTYATQGFGGVTYNIDATGGVRRPGDGSLEAGDRDRGIGVVNGGEDHWDSNGRLTYLRADMPNQRRFYFYRRINDRWP